MSSKFKTPRGTQDRLPEQQSAWLNVTDVFERRFRSAGFGRLDTPLFEDSALFRSAVGATTDIVEKETYDFADKSGDYLTLRPEGTAPVVRAYIQHGMSSRPQPVRLYYCAPLFRYDRPQAGRLRQHHQVGAEILGETDPHADVEVISQLWWFLTSDLGLEGLSLQINSIGRAEDRSRYLQELRTYFAPLEQKLSPDSQRRLKTNPLRILDSKDERDWELTRGAPRSAECLDADGIARLATVRAGLEALGISSNENFRLVRGLDYYTDTVFEIWPARSGGQATMAGGGRYDRLAEQIGGPPTPGMGFGCGIERILLNMAEQNLAPSEDQKADVYVAPLSATASTAALSIANTLRQGGLAVIAGYGAASPRSHLRKANAAGIRWAVIIGQREMEQGQVTLRDMQSGDQQSLATELLLAAIKA